MSLDNLKCPICNSKNIKLEYKDENTERLEVGYAKSGNISELYICNSCYVRFTNFLKDFDKKIYESQNDELYKKSEYARKLTFNKDFNNILKNFDNIEGNILDVGCGPGYFLVIAKKKGYQADGIELSKADCSEANSKGFNVYCTDFISFCEHNKGKSYGLITMFDFIEHVNNPKEIISNCYEILNNNGNLVISTPNIGSLFAKIMGKKWWCFIPMHLFYFNKKSIKYLLEQKGFKILKIKIHTRYINFGNSIEWLRRYGIIYKLVKGITNILHLGKLNFKVTFFDDMIIYATKK